MITSPRNQRLFEILVIDDNAADCVLMRESWAECSIVKTNLNALSDHTQVAKYLHRHGEHARAKIPDLIILDYKMPTNGGAALATIKGDPDCLHIPVIVITGSEDPRDIMEIYRRHANCCHHKPTQLDGYLQLANDIAQHWFVQSVLPQYNTLTLYA